MADAELVRGAANAELTPPSRLAHALRALRGVADANSSKFIRQYGRLGSAVVRPLLWLVVFAAGMANLLGISPLSPFRPTSSFKCTSFPD